MSWDHLHKPMHYDRNGIPISLEEWGRLFENPAYRLIARTTVTDAANLTRTFDVSTVWLGLDHGIGCGPLAIFETMVFGDDAEDLNTRRYSTEPEARKGHVEMVIQVAADLIDPAIMDAPVAQDRDS